MEILVSALAILVALSCVAALIYHEWFKKDDDQNKQAEGLRNTGPNA